QFYQGNSGTSPEIGTHAFNWTWTGFRDHGRVWDWLSILLVPVIVAVLPIWYSLRQSQKQSSQNTTVQ
ncbi:MAG TPA: hypothetical protein VKT25_02085, partial [Ktedonobacteraceae bacterium]|nr:hypothetical protein [Ktedonobacteraceae bacterium]